MTHALIDRALAEATLRELNLAAVTYAALGKVILKDGAEAMRDKLSAALANAEPAINVRTVTVSKFGVSFGNTTVSHERITGRNAEALNEGSGGIVSNEYMKWLNLPKD